VELEEIKDRLAQHEVVYEDYPGQGAVIDKLAMAIKAIHDISESEPESGISDTSSRDAICQIIASGL